MLLWQTLDSVPLPAVIKAKIVNEALQWISKRLAQLQRYANQAELTSELNFTWTTLSFEAGVDPARKFRGAISVIFGRHASVGNQVSFRYVQNHGEKRLFCRF